MKIKKNDQVIIIYGRDKGRKGQVEKVFAKEGLVLVGGVNISKKHLKAKSGREKGGISEVAKPLAAAKVMVICPHCQKPVRVGYHIEKGSKTRVCRSCKLSLEKAKEK